MKIECHCHIRMFQRNAGSLEGLYGQAVSVRCEASMKPASTTW